MVLFNIANRTDERDGYYFGLFDCSKDKLIETIQLLDNEYITTDFIEEDSHPKKSWVKGYSCWIMVDATKFPTKKDCREYVSKKVKRAKKDYFLKNK